MSWLPHCFPVSACKYLLIIEILQVIWLGRNVVHDISSMAKREKEDYEKPFNCFTQVLFQYSKTCVKRPLENRQNKDLT